MRGITIRKSSEGVYHLLVRGVFIKAFMNPMIALAYAYYQYA